MPNKLNSQIISVDFETNVGDDETLHFHFSNQFFERSMINFKDDSIISFCRWMKLNASSKTMEKLNENDVSSQHLISLINL